MASSTEAGRGKDSDGETKIQNAIANLKKIVGDVIQGNPRYDDDWFLFPWIRHCNYNLAQAAASVRETIRWREEMNYEDLGAQDWDPEMRAAIPMTLDVVSRDGFAVVTLVVGGDVDHRAIFAKVGKQRYKLHYFQLFAKLEKMVAAVEKRCNGQISLDTKFGGIAIVDLRDYSFEQARGLNVIQAWYEIANAYRKYGIGLCSHVYIMNANKVFTPILKLIKPVLEGPCLDITICDSNSTKWREELKRRFDPSQLAPNFGGTRKLSS